jgi:hypothetical protein
MFEAELKRAEMKLEVIEQESLNSLQVQWTLLDPSRVLQVLIDVMTNAIKFTRTEDVRHIRMTMGASLTPPSKSHDFGMQYVRKSTTSPDQTSKAEWGDGEVIYLSITVEDTVGGLNDKEINNLFHLFAQASPNIHQTYGGLGLGLFISRQLVEMQGGEIGVVSIAGKGSTFQFYVKTWRTNPPKEVQQNTDFQLLVTDDALREGCGVDIPALQDVVNMPNIEPDMARSMYPSSPSLEVLHTLVVEENIVNQKVVTKQLRKSGHIVSLRTMEKRRWISFDEPNIGMKLRKRKGRSSVLF